MPRKKVNDKAVLSFKIHTRVNEEKYRALLDLLSKTRYQSLSELTRCILESRPVEIVTHDDSLDELMERLSAIEKELRAIGVNINQITKQFNSSTSESVKVLQTIQASGEYKRVGDKVDEVMNLIAELATRWLQK